MQAQAAGIFGAGGGAEVGDHTPLVIAVGAQMAAALMQIADIAGQLTLQEFEGIRAADLQQPLVAEHRQYRCLAVRIGMGVDRYITAAAALRPAGYQKLLPIAHCSGPLIARRLAIIGAKAGVGHTLGYNSACCSRPGGAGAS